MQGLKTLQRDASDWIPPTPHQSMNVGEHCTEGQPCSSPRHLALRRKGLPVCQDAFWKSLLA